MSTWQERERAEAVAWMWKYKPIGMMWIWLRTVGWAYLLLAFRMVRARAHLAVAEWRARLALRQVARADLEKLLVPKDDYTTAMVRAEIERRA